MSMRFVGNCDRCSKKVGGVEDTGKRGLGWADKAGHFAYCHECLEETKLGYAGYGLRPLSKGIYLEDVLKERPYSKQFYLRNARNKWDQKNELKG